MKILCYFILLLGVCIPNFLTAQCRRNAVDCQYGCRRYTDQNNDGFCDLGRLSKPAERTQTEDESATEPAQETTIQATAVQSKQAPKYDTVRAVSSENTIDKASTAEAIKAQAPISGTKKKQTTPSLNPKTQAQTESVSDAMPIPQNHTDTHQRSKSEKSAKDAYADSVLHKWEAHSETSDKQTVQQAQASVQPEPYSFGSIILGTSVGYLITLLLSQAKLIRKVTHRKIWNFVLLVSFLISCIFGLVLVAQINYQWGMSVFDSLLWWHVELGIVMTLVSIFHILWHLPYFRNALGLRANKQTEQTTKQAKPTEKEVVTLNV